MADQQDNNKPGTSSITGLYGENWTPSPDDPNYEAYLKYQQNLEKAKGASGAHAPVTSEEHTAEGDASGQVSPDQSPSQDGRPQRPHQENPNAEASDYFMGPLMKPSHWSDKPNPDAPWWANPYTYVSKGEWRKPNWGDQRASEGRGPETAESEGQQPAPSSQEPGRSSDQGNEGAAPASGTAEAQGSDGASAGAAGQANAAGAPQGAWIPTGDLANPWRWDASAVPNQAIDGKPCLVPRGAWVPSGNPANPWKWDSEVYPNEYREGKPVNLSAQAPASGFATAGQNQGAPFVAFPDLSKESGEDRPDVPMSSRVGWFFIGMIGGFLGLIFAWMVASKYPRKQRNQVVRWCWAGFFAWCLLMFALMGLNVTGDGLTSVITGSEGSSSSGSAFD